MIGILAAPRKGVSEVTYFQLPPLQYPFLYIFSLYFRQRLALDLGGGVKKEKRGAVYCSIRQTRTSLSKIIRSNSH